MSSTHHLQIFIGKKNPPYRFITNPAVRSQMTKSEAQLLLSKAAKASNFLFASVVKLIARRGYLALGFNKPHDCLRKKIPEISNSYICRLIQATDTYITVDPDLTYLQWVSESTFRPLIHLSDKDLIAAWEWALARRKTNSRLSSRDMSKAMDALKIQSHADCVSDHQATITVRIDQEVLPKFNRHIDRICDAIRDSDINSQEEWRIVAKLVYQQLLRNYAGNNNHCNHCN